MSRIVYVNGSYLPEAEAKISVFDRGFLFADGVYEVSSILNGKMLDNAAHLARLRRSMEALRLPSPATDAEIEAAQERLIAENQVKEGMIYLQVTRGSADRDFAFPKETPASLVMFTQSKNLLENAKAETGLRVISIPDIRWERRDIKTVQLLAPALAKQAAVDAGVDDAWLVQDGFVTEGSSNNAYIVTQDNVIVTRHLGNEILAGITRAAILKLANERQYRVEERAFTVEEVKNAAEAFITSASTFALPVVEIDGQPIGNGKVGAVARTLRQIYIETALESTVER